MNDDKKTLINRIKKENLSKLCEALSLASDEIIKSKPKKQEPVKEEYYSPDPFEDSFDGGMGFEPEPIQQINKEEDSNSFESFLKDIDTVTKEEEKKPEVIEPEVIRDGEVVKPTVTINDNEDISFEGMSFDDAFDETPKEEPIKEGEKISLPDALIKSLRTYTSVNLEYIAKVTNLTYEQCIDGLKDSIYQNPLTWEEKIYLGWETKDEYLSGNLFEKYHIAREANKVYNGWFSNNIKALKREMPPLLSSDDIYVSLGSPWLPTSIIEDFIKQNFKIPTSSNYYYSVRVKVIHDEETGSWEIQNKSSLVGYWNSTLCYKEYGTKRMHAMTIIEKLLNMKSIRVTDEDQVIGDDGKPKKRRVLNESETTLAVDKANKIKVLFNDWLWKSKSREKAVLDAYFVRFGAIKPRHFDGSFLTFPGMNKEVTLRSYQKNAIARILLTNNTLLSHDVGSGKSFVMIAAGMELRRLGISRKNMYVVPNNIVSQWEGFFNYLYPGIQLLKVTSSNFGPKDRLKTLKKIRDLDYDAILISYSAFESITISCDERLKQLDDEIEKLSKAIKNSKATAEVRSRLKTLSAKRDKLALSLEGDEIEFDNLGINSLFVDEAHNFKNVPYETKTDRILGLNPTGSSKCLDMLQKVRCVKRLNNGRGIIFATGTPITNSISDVYIMQLYLQEAQLTLLDIHSFDAWVGNFAELATGFEIDVDTSNYRLVRRFSKFHNLNQLTALLSMIADFHQTGEEEDLPTFDGYENQMVEKSKAFERYLKEISKRADKVRKGRISRTEDNMLKITTDGRKAALDLRLVRPPYDLFNKPVNMYVDNPGSKVEVCADNIVEIYSKTEESGGTQLVFCDVSTPKETFNMYDELKRILLKRGIPEEEIKFVHEANTDRKKEKLFKAVRESDVRILIGSTWKLGLGVNVQKHLVAIHHLDVPWRPSDMVQRQGRMLRQGNENEQVYIFRYITNGSFDAYSWQLLETKQQFIDQLLSGNYDQKDGTDVGDTLLSYAEVKALALDSPLIKERIETENEIRRLQILEKKDNEAYKMNLQRYATFPKRIEVAKKEAELAELDLSEKIVTLLSEPEKKELREKIYLTLFNNTMKTTETYISMYCGFQIIAPTAMSVDRPYLILRKNGEYRLDVTNDLVGNLTRIDNFVNKFEDTVNKLKEKVHGLRVDQRRTKDAIDNKPNYKSKIKKLKVRLEEIDKELGVKLEDEQ